ncbi:cytochrome P450 3A13-like [Lineus longissimus]|uniref:cytochrome P450 3A13-like n=1 Tax=Lineus longissimus TaxID=88925 RepID=UPI002B4E7E52
MSLVTGTLLSILVVLLGFLYRYYRARKKRLLYFVERGISGPEPNIIIGNLHQIRNEGVGTVTHRWAAEYGKTYGYFEGPNPVIVTSDLDILKSVFIKDYNRFAARKRFQLAPHPDDTERVNMFFAEGQKWKRQRCIMTPSFSTTKMKQMSPLLNRCIGSMMDVLEERQNEGGPFDVYKNFQALTLDAISSVGFGLDVDSQHDQENVFLQKCRQVFKDVIPGTRTRPLFFILIIVATIFPGLNKYCHRLHHFFHKVGIDLDARYWMQSTAGDIIKQRKEEKYIPNHIDFIQIMLDAEADEVRDNLLEMTKDDVTSQKGDEKDKLNESDSDSSKPQKKSIEKKLTISEMKANCELFLLAGYETTSTALAYAAYQLAINETVQRKLQEEIDEHLEPNVRPDYYTIRGLEYLDMVVSEVLRMHPIAPVVVGRTCLEETTIKGINIEKDVTVMADVASVHYDPEQWGPRDPNIFDPERFRPELKATRHPMAYLPFGAGPRNCIGMRFGLLELKLALASILQKYHINRCPETEVPLQTIEAATICPKNGIMVTLSLRNITD